MAYIIEGLVETLSSDGTFTIHGSEGYCLAKDGKAYNVFWENSGNDSGKSGNSESGAVNLVACPQKDCKLRVPTDGRQWEFQLLTSAKANRQKVGVGVEVTSIDDLKSATKTKVTLL